MCFSQQVAALETVDEVMVLVRAQVEESARLDRECRDVLSRERERGGSSASRERVLRMAEVQLDGAVEECRRRVRMLYERAEELERARAGDEVGGAVATAAYDTQSKARCWWEYVLLPGDGSGGA